MSEAAGPDPVLLAEHTWQEVATFAEEGRRVIIPIGSTEAHGPHLPIDVDTHSADTVARMLAARIDALVAPVIPYSYAQMWMGFPGTMSLTPSTFIDVLSEISLSLVKHGFRRIVLLNGHRPNGTSVDVAARHVVDQVDTDEPLEISALSYWEPGAARVHAIRKSAVGGMGHACELETSTHLWSRPHLVHMDRLEGVDTPLVGWDLVAPMPAARTYQVWPEAAAKDVAVFGDPSVASAESGEAFLEAIVGGLVDLFEGLDRGEGGTYAARTEDDAD